jgi:hypothetical protein
VALAKSHWVPTLEQAKVLAQSLLETSLAVSVKLWVRSPSVLLQAALPKPLVQLLWVVVLAVPTKAPVHSHLARVLVLQTKVTALWPSVPLLEPQVRRHAVS